MMEHEEVREGLYEDIARRTNGEIYIGVVGPVRTGKSTFIKRFMETLVLPNLTDSFEKERARDEMPQSAAGRTVMTTEPKFVPDEAVTVTLQGNAVMRVRMVDCVGYLIPDALGSDENGGPRMVHTPWSETPMPFEKAAETGTRKVITDHSTIGVVVTTDGSIGEIPRARYEDAEKRVIRELKELRKPFVVVINSAHPEDEESVRLAMQTEETYGVPVALVNCLELSGEDVTQILSMLLPEFPVREVKVSMPSWIPALPAEHPLHGILSGRIWEAASRLHRMGEVREAFAELTGDEDSPIRSADVTRMDLGSGCAEVTLALRDGLYYRTLSELTGLELTDEASMIGMLCEMAQIRKKYDRLAKALDDAERDGYGIVTPEVDDLRLEEPEIIRQTGGYGVRLRASGPSLHLIRAEIQTEIEPTVGSEQQSEELVKFLLREFEENPASLWDSHIFGKTLSELVTEGLHAKLAHMPSDARQKLSETLQRIINEGSGGLICILL